MIRMRIIVALLLAWPAGAHATLIMPLQDGELVERAQLIVTGDVVSIRSAPAADGAGVRSFVRIAVEERLRGELEEREIVLGLAGGRFGERFAWIEGSPEFRVGEQVLLLLAGDAAGELRPVGMYQGKFTLQWDAAGGRRIARQVPEGVLAIAPGAAASNGVRDLDGLRRLAASRAFRGTARTLRAYPADYAAAAAAGKETAAFTLLNGARWPDERLPVGYRVAPGFQAGTADGGRPTVQAAMAAWSDVPGSSLARYDAGTGAAARVLLCNFANEVNFNDPFGEIPDGEGILAVGGFCSFGPYIFEGNLTFNDDAISTTFFGLPDCFAHVATHELGHTIGLGHSLNPQALMAPTVSPSSCRGTSLHPDDIAGVQFLYGGDGGGSGLDAPSGVGARAFGNLVVVWFGAVAEADSYEVVALGVCDPCAVVERSPLVTVAPAGEYRIAVRARSGDAVSGLSQIVTLRVGG